MDGTFCSMEYFQLKKKTLLGVNEALGCEMARLIKGATPSDPQRKVPENTRRRKC